MKELMNVRNVSRLIRYLLLVFMLAGGGYSLQLATRRLMTFPYRLP